MDNKVNGCILRCTNGCKYGLPKNAIHVMRSILHIDFWAIDSYGKNWIF